MKMHTQMKSFKTVILATLVKAMGATFIRLVCLNSDL
jgi:hypothetical protein